MNRFITGCIALAISSTTLAQEAARQVSTLSDQQSASPSTVQSLGVRQRVEVIAGSDKEEATISIGKRLGKSVYNLSLTTPIDKEKKQGTFGNLDGLSDALRGKLTYVRQLSDPDKWNARLDLKAAKRVCYEAGIARGFTREYLKAKDDEGDLDCDALTSPGADDDALYKNPKDRRQKREIAHVLRSIRENYLRAQWGGEWTSSFQSALTVGAEEFDFLDPTTYAKTNSNETEWAASLGIGWLNIVDRMSIAVGYRRESAYDPSEKKTLCTPTAVPEQLECSTSSVGKPVKKDSDLATVQLEVLREGWALTSLATYNFETDEYGIEMPLYFVKDEKASWTGGVSVGWTSENRDITVQIFVGVPFSLLD